MNTRKRIIAAAGAALLGVATIAAAGTANAASVPVNFQVTGGSLTIGAETLDFPSGASFSGTWDDETGALSGTLDVPAFTLEVEVGEDTLPVGISIVQVGDATGNVNPETGAATLSVTLNVVLDLGVPGCGINGITIGLSSAGNGGAPLDFDTGVMTLVGSEFEVPATSNCGVLAAAIDPVLGLPTVETAISITLQGEGSDDTTTTAAPTTTVPVDTTPTTDVDTGGTLPPTGSSDSTSIMAGIALLVLGAGMALTMTARRRGDVQ